MRADQGALQLVAPLGGDDRRGERSETRRYSVHRLRRGGVGLDDLGARLESGAGIGPDSDRCSVAGDGDHGVAVEARGSEDDRGAHVYSIVKPTISAPADSPAGST